jgi:hypothetical protein
MFFKTMKNKLLRKRKLDFQNISANQNKLFFKKLFKFKHLNLYT